MIGQGVKIACEQLIGRLNVFKEKVKEETGKDVPWPKLVRLCKVADVDLSERIW